MNTSDYGIGTLAIHGNFAEQEMDALAAPIFQTSTFIQNGSKQGDRHFGYTRGSNPTVAQLEEKLALLENGESCQAFSSGMGAIAGVFHTFLQQGDYVLTDISLYGCTRNLLKKGLQKNGIHTDFIDTAHLEDVKTFLGSHTRLIFLETPSNPVLKLCDIHEICRLRDQKAPQALVVVDNTFATPCLTRPLELGADIVVHSATKYINGHGDLIAGAAIGSNDLISRINSCGLEYMTGACLNPLEAFLTLRGLKTLKLRMRQHCENAYRIAQFLESHPAVKSVVYPGLPSHPQYALAQKQMKAGGAMIAFTLKGGAAAATALLDQTRLCSFAVSLGDCETLMEPPYTVTHGSLEPELKKRLNITEGMLRFSAGLEDPEDIIRDLQSVLDSLTVG